MKILKFFTVILLVVVVGVNAKFDNVIAVDDVSNSQPWIVPEWEFESPPDESSQQPQPEENTSENPPENTEDLPEDTPEDIIEDIPEDVETPIIPPAQPINPPQVIIPDDFEQDNGFNGFENNTGWNNAGQVDDFYVGGDFNSTNPSDENFIDETNENYQEEKNPVFKTVQFKNINNANFVDTGIKLTDEELKNNSISFENFSQLLDYFVVHYDAKKIPSDKSIVLLIDNTLLKFDKDNLSLNYLQSVFKEVSIKIDFLTSRTNGKYNLADYYEFAGEIPLIVNGKKVEWLTEPIIKDSIAMLPIRSVAEALNAKVVWDDKSQTATISKDNTTIIVPLNKDVVSVNGSQYKIPNNSILKDNRTLSTISFIVENLNASMVWDAQINSLVISSK